MAKIRGRFAPSPSGRMHLGNFFAALLAWLDVRSQGGEMVLRIEDLDPERCTRERAEQVVDDLRWLGLDWDEGGMEPGYWQSSRFHRYEEAFARLSAQGLLYPCYCTRAERMASSAPHASDRIGVYGGKCRNLTEKERRGFERMGRRPAWRIQVPDEELELMDGHMGPYVENLLRDCGDFILRRSDGAWAYQLAVVVDDAEMGINRVVRGSDLLSSAPRQSWLHHRLGYRPPAFFHTPLLLAPDGRRLSKREGDLDAGALRSRYTAEELTGLLACWAGLQKEPRPVSPAELVEGFCWKKVPIEPIYVPLEQLR